MQEFTEGLEGITATSSSICSLDDAILRYCGYKAEELCKKASFEEVIYLLWNRELPTQAQLAAFIHELNQYTQLPSDLIVLLKSLPPTASTMDVLRTAISHLGLMEMNQNPSSPARAQAYKLMMQILFLVPAWHHIRQGKDPIYPDSGLSYAEKFLHAMQIKPTTDAVEAMNLALILHADHELNASTFSARVTVATLSDIYSGVTAAIGTLKGPLHGGANTAVMEMLEKIGHLDKVDAFFKDITERKQKIMGFGHRVYKDGDPRADILKGTSEKLSKAAGQQEYFNISKRLEELAFESKKLKPNVDFYSATLYHALGVPKDLFTPIFAIARMAGWTAHIIEQLENNRLIRPRAAYTGSPARAFVPLNQRH